MASIRFRSNSEQQLQDVLTQVRQDLQQTQLDKHLNLSGIIRQRKTGGNSIHGDAITWATVVMIAANTNGSLSALLQKDRLLVTIAQFLARYTTGQQVEVVLETKEGKDVLRGAESDIKATLEKVDD